MRHGSLFSGVGGFDLAAQWMGWENVFHCEWNEFGQKILKHYWPNAISYGDITKTDFTVHRGAVDILTGGFPCQPYSMAGQRLGKEDDRHLWPECIRLVREVKPDYCVFENVLGIVSWNGGLVFNEVQADLEAEGYEVQPYVLPACAVNAPHRRDRVWFVAHNNSVIRGTRGEYKSREQSRHGESVSENVVKWVAPDTEHVRLQHSQEAGNISGGERASRREGCESSESAETNGGGRAAPNPYGQRYEKFISTTKSGKSCGFNREKDFKFRGIPTWNNFPTTQPTIRRGDDGLSERLVGITFSKHRNESIRAYGNAIVPQVVYQIFKAIEKYEQLTP